MNSPDLELSRSKRRRAWMSRGRRWQRVPPLVNGQEEQQQQQEEEGTPNPVVEDPPSAEEEEVLKEDEEEKNEPPVSQDPEQLPKESDSTETFASLPNATVSNPEVADSDSGDGTPEAAPKAAPKARPSPSHPPAPPDFYCVKWINWKGERTPVITQSENGPCPLLAIMNILFLQWKVKLPPQKEVITSDELMAHLGLIAEQFLESTASQLTYHGLCELTATVTEGELSVFFRNNHFSAMIKHQSHLYLLVTDQGFLHEEQVAWESLHNVDGDSCFCDAEFHLSHALGKEAAGSSPQEQQLNQRQVDQDYMIALSLQQQQGGPPLSDLELAQQLQQEEYQQQQPATATSAVPAQGRGQPTARPAGERRQRPKQDSDCVVL
ncbi:hypothetical protein lerEdw1_014285 [Lerista edwardsae]|nr:hypothetical protein lerEdw1_014286 [Lerista edwardsae]KAJ6633844.1 hypothetical protein lerEdw1_014285 [Lerista edwardsae]